MSKHFEEINAKLLEMLPKDQFNEVMSLYCGDIDPTFLGFVDTYYFLSKIIPEDFTIIDLGCGYNPQCYFFQNHKAYFSVDVFSGVMFKTDNCTIFNNSIDSFIKEDMPKLDVDIKKTFAICNYSMPYIKTQKLVRKTFPNLYIYYP